MSHQTKTSIGALHRAHLLLNDEIQVLNIILHRDLTHRDPKMPWSRSKHNEINHIHIEDS